MFSIAAVLVYIPTNSVRGFPFLHTLSSIYCFRLFDSSHSDQRYHYILSDLCHLVILLLWLLTCPQTCCCLFLETIVSALGIAILKTKIRIFFFWHNTKAVHSSLLVVFISFLPTHPFPFSPFHPNSLP